MFVRRGATGGEGAQRGRPVSGANALLGLELPRAGKVEGRQRMG